MSIPAPHPGSAALVTGASSGIGEALARQLAERRHNVVLVARRRERLEKLAAQLRELHGVRADVLPTDLSDAADRDKLQHDLAALDVDIDVAVLCAGFGMVGPLLEHDADRTIMMLRTNFEATVALARALTPAMVSRKRGAVLIVSSTTGDQPMPNFAPYSASKAAVTSFGEALHSELKPHGVTVSVLVPGPTATEWVAVAEAETQAARQPAFFVASADQVARAGIKALEMGKRRVIPLPQAKAFAWVTAHLPKRIWLPACRKMLS